MLWTTNNNRWRHDSIRHRPSLVRLSWLSFQRTLKSTRHSTDSPTSLCMWQLMHVHHILVTVGIVTFGTVRWFNSSEVYVLLCKLMPSSHRRQDCQDCRIEKISKLTMVSFFAVLSCLEMRCKLSFVLSWRSFQFATIQSQIYRGLLKTVLTCRQLSSHHRHGQDKTLSVSYTHLTLPTILRV